MKFYKRWTALYFIWVNACAQIYGFTITQIFELHQTYLGYRKDHVSLKNVSLDSVKKFKKQSTLFRIFCQLLDIKQPLILI